MPVHRIADSYKTEFPTVLLKGVSKLSYGEDP